MIQIINKTDCCGCTSCASICAHNAISMVPDETGFLYPVVDKKKCTECKLCEKVCPIIHRKTTDLTPNQIEYIALRIKNKDLLQKSSSGGAFMALSLYILKQGGIICGAKYSDNAKVIHDFAEDKERAEAFMGSKYSQSDIRGIFKKIKLYLQSNRLVLFTGTPCQVHGLKAYLRKKYDNLITVDLVCHAVPSPLIFEQYIKYCSEILGSKITSIDMRCKTPYGWGHKTSYRYHLENGEKIINPDKIEIWNRIFFSKLVDRPSCHDCKYTNYNRCSDITIADFWDDKRNRPDIYSKEGTSLCLINSIQGKEILDNIKDEVEIWTISKKESEQPCLLYPTPSNPKRDIFWKDYHEKGFKYIYMKYFTDSYYVRFKKLLKTLVLSKSVK